MSEIAIKVFNFEIYWYSIMLIIAVLTGGHLVLKEIKRHNISEDKIINMFIGIFITALIGARLYFIVFNLKYYTSNPTEILNVRSGGLAIHGGLIGALIYIIYYTKKQKLPLYKILDILVVSLIIGQSIGRWGNFFNQEAYGPITTQATLKSFLIPNFIINGMLINGSYRQPTFLYESIWSLTGFIIINIIKRKNIKETNLTSFYLIWYSIGRFFIESLRTDSLMLMNFKIAQIISLLMIILGIIILIKSKDKENYNKIRRKNERKI